MHLQLSLAAKQKKKPVERKQFHTCKCYGDECIVKTHKLTKLSIIVHKTVSKKKVLLMFPSFHLLPHRFLARFVLIRCFVVFLQKGRAMRQRENKNKTTREEKKINKVMMEEVHAFRISS